MRKPICQRAVQACRVLGAAGWPDEHSKDSVCFISMCTALISSSMHSSSMWTGKGVFRSIFWNKMLQGVQSFPCRGLAGTGSALHAQTAYSVQQSCSHPAAPQTRGQGDHCGLLFLSNQRYRCTGLTEVFPSSCSALMVQILTAEFVPPSCNESSAPVTGPSDVGANTSPDPAVLWGLT